MADILPSTVVQTVLETLTSSALQEIGVPWGLEDELERLGSILSTVKSVLRDAEQKQRKNEELQDWLKKLKRAADDAEDILDEIKNESFKRRRGTLSQLSSYFSLRWLSHKRKVKEVREKLDDIAEERRKFHLIETEVVSDNSVGGTVESRQTGSLVNEQEIVGRKEEKETIIKTLLETARDHELSVYAIWGMGGLGKTTLAQLVYNDETTKSHFDLRIWVCVSGDFRIRKVLRAIIESVDLCGCNISTLDPLQRCVQEKLRGKKVLLVLDDVWNEKDWDVQKEVLRRGSRGGVLMVTTRIEKVARMMATIPIRQLECLSEDDSWSLFRQRAFAVGEVEESLTEIGKAMAKKCGGLPLALKLLGSLMRTKNSEREWSAIEESGIGLLPEHENGILPVLRLSYDNLPPHMRQCFAYCCIFPKGYRMNEDQLIELWMANGFLISEGQRGLYLKGQQIFEELICRAFFQDVCGKTCKMHDLVHDLAKSVMKDETYVVEHGKALNIPKMTRHLFLDVGVWLFPKDERKLPLVAPKSLHSLIVHGFSLPFGEENLSSFLSEQQSLRVLHLPVGFSFRSTLCVQSKLHHSICKLEHLKYLAMSCFGQKMLPESLTFLHHLQTLKLSESHHLLELPKGLKHMKNLWFLDIESHESLVCMPPGVGELTYLQRLSIFIVGEDPATQIDQLKELNLGGKLSIQGLGNVRNFEDARNANLMGKKNLTSLTLSWKKGTEENSAENFEEVLEGLQPHHNLEKLFIGLYQGSRFPNWMSTLACKNLTEISLESCRRCERLPSLGKLPALMRLNLWEMDSIKHLDAEWHGNGETSFPALTNLQIDRMPNFEEWTMPDSGESFPSLKCLTIRRCPKLNGLPSLPALRNLSILDSNGALLRSVGFLSSLTSISLSFFEELDILPEGFLQHNQNLEVLTIYGFCNIRTLSNVLDNKPALRNLHLAYCSNLEFLPTGLEHLNSLEHVELSKCDCLTSFPATILQDLSYLQTLVIDNCKRLNPLSGELPRESALKHLLIKNCPEFKNFPESMQQLTSLRDLSIWDCKELRSLPNWLGRLQSLSTMSIYNSKYLNSLPDDFQSPESLRSLWLDGCDPQLEKRCKKPEGEDWPKISRIPYVRINSKIIQNQGL